MTECALFILKEKSLILGILVVLIAVPGLQPLDAGDVPLIPCQFFPKGNFLLFLGTSICLMCYL